MVLDIIIPHYKESWETGSKFFTMLDLQRGVNFEDIHVIIVNDGADNHLPDDLFASRPYRVSQIDIEHGGVSAARNAGLKAATAEWVMFCDFDDMFACVYSLRDILHVLPAPDYDMLWADFLSEDKMKDGSIKLHNRGENVVFIHGKLYRRKYLLDNDLWFDTDLEFNEDSAFNTILQTIIDYKRTGKINTTGPLYVWCFTENSLTTTPGNHPHAMVGAYYRNKKVCEAFKKRMPDDRYCAMVARTVMDTYYTLNIPVLTPELEKVKADFIKFWKDHKADYAKVPIGTLREVKAVSRSEHKLGEQEEEERWAIEHVDKVDESLSVTQWLKKIEEEEEV